MIVDCWTIHGAGRQAELPFTLRLKSFRVPRRHCHDRVQRTNCTFVVFRASAANTGPEVSISCDVDRPVCTQNLRLPTSRTFDRGQLSLRRRDASAASRLVETAPQLPSRPLPSPR